MKNIKVKNEGDLENLLGQMAEHGLIKEVFDKKDHDLKYSLLQKGTDQAEELLKTNRTARIFLIQVHMNFHDDFYEALFSVAKFMKERFSINLFQDIINAIDNGEVKGIEIEDRNAFIDLYDKI